ncbi:MAG: hypothetical protein N2749_04325 [Clostridia bacterium]|nr:hypothetical protein [Clostridia bacterium]
MKLNNIWRKVSIVKVTFILVMISVYFFSFSVNIFAGAVNKSYVDISSPSGVVIDFSTGRVLYEKNAYEKRAMASLTKVMTSIMLVENCNMDELIEVPAAATWQGGSEVGLKKGEKVTARALLYGMLLPSRK